MAADSHLMPMDRRMLNALGVFFLLALALPLLHAAAPPPDLSDFAVGLPADIAVPNTTFNQTPALVEVTARVQNTGQGDWIVYLLEDQNGTWVNERALGVVQPGQTENLSIDFQAKYSGVSRLTHQFALVASGGDVPLGQYFKVTEDWSAYEQQANAQLHEAALVLVPATAGVVLVLLIALAEWGYSAKASGAYKGEYTTRSLFLPRLSGAPLGEEIADLMTHPVFWGMELLVVLVTAILVGSNWSAQARPDWVWVLLLTGIGAVVLPLVYFAMVWAYNRQVERTPMRFFAAAFFWGALAAVLALVASTIYG
ncbi:MAG: hypothetical protein KGH63_04935, partial [Candidatus Micrarchaeota archaeon]|nr:hypothetical protein [Candidatus Micrarchaeota archaeon]